MRLWSTSTLFFPNFFRHPWGNINLQTFCHTCSCFFPNVTYCSYWNWKLVGHSGINPFFTFRFTVLLNRISTTAYHLELTKFFCALGFVDWSTWIILIPGVRVEIRLRMWGKEMRIEDYASKVDFYSQFVQASTSK